MAKFHVQLVGGPKATTTVLDFSDGVPPRELAVNLEPGPPITGEEQAAPTGRVMSQAIYRHYETAVDGLEVYAYLRERSVYG